MNHSVIIVGAGWAGLSAAYSLVKQGIHVTLIEAAPQAGGRARGISFHQDQVDNGQHLFLGAYHHCLSILNDLGISEETVFHRTPLWLKMNGQTPLEIKLNQLIPPLNLIVGIITAKGLGAAERKAALRFCRELNSIQFKLPEDISVLTLLQNFRQPPTLISQLWGPLALAALSTPIEKASAQVFLNVLKQSFTQESKNSNFLFPKTDLSSLFVDPMINFLKKKGATLLFNQRVEELLIEEDRCVGVKTSEQLYRGSHTIVATSPSRAAALLKAPSLKPLQQTVSQFQPQPITTVYLRFEHSVRLSHPMLGFMDQTAHWVFDRITANQPGLLSVVITGRGPHSEWTQNQLVETLVQELKQRDPDLKDPLSSKVICEKSAAFLCEVDIDKWRPSQQTPMNGLYLAGDYTEAGYPASLEAALKSGLGAAELIAKHHFSSSTLPLKGEYL